MNAYADDAGPNPVSRFWNFLLAAAALFAGMALYAHYFVDKLTTDASGATVVKAGYSDRWQDQLPELLGYQDELFQNMRPRIEAAIDANVDEAFTPVYGQITPYADFHYSIIGQYTEISAVVIGQFVDTISSRLYDAVDFEERMRSANDAISGAAEAEIGAALAALRERTRSSVGLSRSDMPLLDGAIQLTQGSVATRFLATRTAGYVVGRTLTRHGMRVFVNGLARALGGKVASRAAARTAGIGAAAGTGAATGSVLGPLGTAAGGAIGALVGWLAFDAVAITIDEAINRESFEEEIKKMIDDQKAAIKVAMMEKISKALDEIDRDVEEEFRKIKAQPAGETLFGQ